MKKWMLPAILCLCLFCSGCKNNVSIILPSSNGPDTSQTMTAQSDDVIPPDKVNTNPNESDPDAPAQEPEEHSLEAISTSRTIECHLCHGDGVCYHCDGEPFQNGRRCSVCGGTGDCTACEGAGCLEVIEIDGADYTVCTSCHGDGMCGLCDGTGKIVHQYSTLGQTNSDCSLCHGSGNCLGCKGTGLSEVKGF